MADKTDKKTDTWMPLWIGAYLADTMKLTTLQHGAYFLLLIAYWRERKPLADIDDELRSITKLERADWRRIKPVLAGFFKVGDGVWWHKRVESEIAAAEERSKKASEKAGKAAQARWSNTDKHAASNAPSMPQALHEDMHDECPPPSPITSAPSVQKAKRKRSPSFDAAGIELPDWIDRDLWGEWCADRRERGKPITERAATQQLNSLDEYRRSGHPPERVIRHAIASGNQGLYPPPRVQQGEAAGKSFRQVDADAKAARVREMVGSTFDRYDPDTIDMEAPNGALATLR